MAQNSIPPADLPTTLLAAYRAARYEFALAGTTLPLRIGRPSPAILEQALPATAYALLTAWNPQSLPSDDAINAAADAVLQAQLDALGLPRLPATGSAEDGRWHEHGWLVAGLSTGAADDLARRHGQAGILYWPSGQPVRLRMYRRPMPDEEGTPDVDWVASRPPL